MGEPSNYELLPLPELKHSMGQDEQYLKPEGRKGDAFAKYMALTAAAVLLIVTWAVVLSNNPTSLGWFALHPLLQIVAVFLFTWGIQTLQPTSQPKTKAAGLVRHQAAIFFVAVPCMSLGTLAIMYKKWLRAANHFTSWHGTIGIICMVWLLFQVGLGAGSVWFRGAAFGGGAKAKAVWKYHRLSGYLLFPLLLATVHLGGAWSDWATEHSTSSVRIVTYSIAPALILGSIFARARLSKMKFF